MELVFFLVTSNCTPIMMFVSITYLYLPVIILEIFRQLMKVDTFSYTVCGVTGRKLVFSFLFTWSVHTALFCVTTNIENIFENTAVLVVKHPVYTRYIMSIDIWLREYRLLL